MITLTDGCHAIELIREAVAAGARQNKACAVLETSSRTYQCWTQENTVTTVAALMPSDLFRPTFASQGALWNERVREYFSH